MLTNPIGEIDVNSVYFARDYAEFLGHIMIRLLFVSALALFTFSASAGTVEDEIAARIAKVGEVCIEGHDCAASSGGSASASAGAGGGVDATYNTSCATCHATGAAGAPMLGDVAAWAPRLDKGVDTLVSSVVNGLGAMPAKGMCFNCSDDDFKALVDYMVDSVQ